MMKYRYPEFTLSRSILCLMMVHHPIQLLSPSCTWTYDQVLLDSGKFYLEHNGEFRVDTASSATKILQSSHIRYDIIISGYRIEEMDGIGFLRSIRKTFGEIPFILLLGPGEEDVVIDAINSGADFYLHKNSEAGGSVP